MKIGVFSRTYETADLDDTYRRMKTHGITHTQFNFSNVGLPSLPTEIPEDTLSFIGEKTAEYGIHIDALTGTFNMIDPQEDRRQAGCEQFRLQCRAAQELHIPLITLCTGSRSPLGKWTWDDHNTSDEAWEDLIHSTERILAYAEESGIVLGVETEASNVINTPEKARKYLDYFHSEHLKIVMDGANLFRPEQIPYMTQVLTDAFRLLGPDIVSAHAKDLSIEQGMDFVAAGQGCLDFPLYIQLLREAGYDGVIMMHGLSEAQVPQSKSFLEKLL